MTPGAASKVYYRTVTVFCLALIFSEGSAVLAKKVRKFHFKVEYLNVTRLCHTKQLVAVNGQFPGPAQYVHEDDEVHVKVTNLVPYNVTIHWHGLHMKLAAWADGPAYITQCPLQTGHSYTHKFTVKGQLGTLLWHAHISWLRATVHGAFIILPKKEPHKPLYPFPKPHAEVPLTLGEWWNGNVEDIAAAAENGDGAPYNISDALTINGQPGDLYNCSQPGEVYNDFRTTIVVRAKPGQRLLLRIINAAVNFSLWFGVANHTLTVVEADGEYTKPYTVDAIVLSPGQTTNVLLTATQKCGQFYMAAFPYAPAAAIVYPETATTAILEYDCACPNTTISTDSPIFPNLPAANDNALYTEFNRNLRSLNNEDVPLSINRNLFFTVGYSLLPCSRELDCDALGGRLQGSVNNVIFATPNISILQAYYHNMSGIYSTDFPSQPPYPFDYTGPAPVNPASEIGTRVSVLEFNDEVELILQNQGIFAFANHPFHLHGQSFYIVGTGYGNYHRNFSSGFNLVDPPLRNTVGVPVTGWAAIRFRAHNPGAWLFHCHIDLHTSWGMQMVFLTKNGKEDNQILPPPPHRLPPC